MEAIQPIQPETLAAKIEKIQNFEYPELLEQFGKEPELLSLLWHLEFVSHPTNYPGGLTRFTEDFLSAKSGAIGTGRMATAKSKNGRYALADAIKIVSELSDDALGALFGKKSWIIRTKYVSDREQEVEWFDGDEIPKLPDNRECDALLVQTLTEQSVRKVCEGAARSELGEYFKRLCEIPAVGLRELSPESPLVSRYLKERSPTGPPWYFVNVADALLSFIADRAEAIRAQLADTEITQLVTRWIRKSRTLKQPVMIIGNSRFGKTEAIKMNAAIAPGKCRLVETPSSTVIGDLLREVAKSLGLQMALHNSSPRSLMERIDYVLRYSGLQLIFDEAQFLIPGAFSRNTAPARLNWVRRTIMDRNIPVVFIATPQSYLPAKRRFVRATGFAMEQFDERILKTVELPAELSEVDLLAVVKVYFRELRAEYQQFVADHVISSERNFVSDVRKISLLAKDSALEAGRNAPILSDLEAAMAEVLPTTRSAGAAGPKSGGRSDPQPLDLPPCRHSAKPLLKPHKRSAPLRIPSRETPVMIDDT